MKQKLEKLREATIRDQQRVKAIVTQSDEMRLKIRRESHDSVKNYDIEQL